MRAHTTVLIDILTETRIRWEELLSMLPVELPSAGEVIC